MTLLQSFLVLVLACSISEVVMCSECPTTSAPMTTAASSPEHMSTQTPVSSVNVDGSSSEHTSQDGAALSIASSPTTTTSVLPSPVPASLSPPLAMFSSYSFANSAQSSISLPSIPPTSTPPTSVMSSLRSADQAVTSEPTSAPDGTPDPSSVVMVPLGSTSGPEVAIGVCIAAVLVLVLVVVFVIVLVAVCITRKNRKYELSNSPMYDTPPDVYYTFGSERAMVPQNGHELVAMSSSHGEVGSVPSAFVIGNNSAAVYITPTAQPLKHSATDPLDSLYTSLNVPDVPQLYTQLNTATKPDKTTQSATDPLDSQYTSLNVPDVPQLYTQLNTATKPGEYIYCNSLDKRNIPIPSELYEEVRIPNHDTEGTTDSGHEYI